MYFHVTTRRSFSFDSFHRIRNFMHELWHGEEIDLCTFQMNVVNRLNVVNLPDISVDQPVHMRKLLVICQLDIFLFSPLFT